MNQALLLQGVKELLPEDRRTWHPGLALDKLSTPGRQEEQKPKLDRVCDATGAPGLLRELSVRRDAVLGHSEAMTWEATTSAPLTLHLSRANALENAGIALHPLYGFAYLPGSSLKGAARAYAETIWLPDQQPEQKAAHEQIIAVFGCAPGSDKDKDWLPAYRQQAEDSSIGAVVFHDAWPQVWPKLFVDIAAIHHPKYYQSPDGNVPPPGDWETPTLINFLAIRPGTTFRFALAPRVKGIDAKLMALAQAWLNGALATLGVGAKTAAGYGLFKTDESTAAKTPLNRLEASFELKLVTPAFLAGAVQGQEDCDLRGATLRGQLRWWWRTLHAAHLEPATLRRLEAAVWGASSEGSAIQIRLTASANSPAEEFNYNAKRHGEFLEPNGIDPSSKDVPESERRKTTQGLYYASYGVGTEGQKNGRFFRRPGSTWHLHVSARKSAFRSGEDAKRQILPTEILRQAEAALFLLTRYGGVGAKGRKGFGSFEDIAIDGFGSIEDCKRAASDFRHVCGLPKTASTTGEDAPSQELMSEPTVIQTKWTNAWFALNRIGEAMQAYAKTGRHQAWKSALGLPRKGDRGPLAVKAGTITRHAAPVHFHVAKSHEALVVRLVTFVSPHLPDRKTSEARLTALRDHVLQLIGKQANQGGTAALFPKTQMAVPTSDGGQPRVGSRIQAELLAEKTKKGGWRARDLARGTERSIQNTHMVPADKKPGDIVELEVPNSSEFKWPVPPPARPTASPSGGPRGRR